MRAAIYCRVSSDRQRENNTIQSQKEILPELAKSKGYEIVNTYVDDGISGETIEARPGFTQLLMDAEAKLFDAVFVIDYDRLSRASDMGQGAYIKKIFKDNKIIVFTRLQKFDFTNEDDDFISDLMGSLAKYEKIKIKSRMSRGRIAKWKQGRHAHGKTLYGYRWNGEKHELFESEAKVVRLIYDLALTNIGVVQISKELERRGIQTPGESRKIPNKRRNNYLWCNSTILRLLHDSTYYGDQIRNRFERHGHRISVKPESGWIHIQVPAIVSREEWETVQKLLLKKKKLSGNIRHNYLLRQLIKCGECGAGMSSETTEYDPTNYVIAYYVCYRRRRPRDMPGVCDTPYYRQEPIDAAVWSAVVRLIDEPEFLKAEIRKDFEAKTKEADTGLSREAVEKMIQAKKVERERVRTLFRKGKINDAEADEDFDKIDAEESFLRRNLDLIENREKVERSMTQSLDRIEDSLVIMRKRLHLLNLDEKRHLIETLTYDNGPGITVKKNGEIEFSGLVRFEDADKLAERIEVISVA